MKKTLAFLGLISTIGGTALAAVPANVQAATVNVSTPTTSYATQSYQQDFVNKIKAYAQKCALQYGLYPSVQMAQAILESDWGRSQLALAPNYNLFGIKKGEGWTGATVTMPTQEWDANAGKYVTINAQFRKYPSFFESFTDNAKKLRLGPGSWNPQYYKGAWMENTTSYKDATKALTGTYATDPNYNTKLNRVIEQNNLAQYDPQIKTVNKVVAVAASSATIYNTFTGVRKATGQTLPQNTTWRANREVTLADGSTWYDLGKNQWASAGQVVVPGQTTPFNGVAKVNYVPGYGIAIWNKATSDRTFTGKRLTHGTSWRVFKKTVVDGHAWYNLGGDQWIDSQYVIVKAD